MSSRDLVTVVFRILGVLLGLHTVGTAFAWFLIFTQLAIAIYFLRGGRPHAVFSGGLGASGVIPILGRFYAGLVSARWQLARIRAIGRDDD